MSTLSARTARVYQERERERMNEKRVLSSRVNSDWLRFLTSSYLMPYLPTYFPLTCGWLYTKVFLLSMSPSLFLSLLFSGQSVSCVGCKLFLARSVKFLLKYYEKFIQFSFVCRPLKVQSKSHLVLLLLTFQLSLSPSLSLPLYLLLSPHSLSLCYFPSAALPLPLSRLTHSNLTSASLIQCAIHSSHISHLFALHQRRTAQRGGGASLNPQPNRSRYSGILHLRPCRT